VTYQVSLTWREDD